MLRLLKSAPLRRDTPDAELVRRAQKGDSDAFAMLFERHGPAIKRFVRDLLRDAAAADDALQETFTRAHVQLIKLPEPDRFKPWVFGIARNVVFESKRVRQHSDIDSSDSDLPAAVLPSPTPETALLDEELRKTFNGALEMLSADRRSALLMRVDHGLSYDDIAAATGWSLQTVKNEIHRVRLTLREALRPHVGGVS